MATLAPPPNKYRAPLAEAMRAQARRAVEAPVPHPDATAPVVRVACVVLAGGYALNQWLRLLEGRPAHALALAALLAGGGAGRAGRAGRALCRARRRADLRPSVGRGGGLRAVAGRRHARRAAAAGTRTARRGLRRGRRARCPGPGAAHRRLGADRRR